MMMKSTISSLLLSLMSLSTFAQVGIFTDSPSATLDIEAQNATGTSTTVDGLLIPRIDRERAQSMTGVPTSTLIYINDISTGSLSDTAANIDALGYYLFDGDAWAKLIIATTEPISNINIYNTDSSLTGNRTVTQSTDSLTFTGTSVNSFSVDGSTFSVDASNNRVGIGTSTPDNTLHVSASADPLKLTGLQESTTSSGSINIDGTGVVHLRNSSSLSAVVAKGTTSITANNTSFATNSSANPTIVFDNLSEFSGNTFTATDTGLYQLFYLVNYPQRSTSSDSSDGYIGMAILSGASTRILRAYVSPTQSGGAPIYVSVVMPMTLKMDAGATLSFEVYVYGASNSSSDIISAAYQISIARID